VSLIIWVGPKAGSPLRPLLRPCVRRDFPNFLFLRVSEKFGCQSTEFFRKKPEFSNSQNFCEKVQKKVWKFKFGKKFGYYSKMYGNFKKSMKSLSFWVKKPCFWVKSSENSKKVWKSSESSETGFSECSETGFSECSEISEIVLFRTFRKLRKNDVKLGLRKSRKTRSDSKVWLKVWNAGP